LSQIGVQPVSPINKLAIGIALAALKVNLLA
jgi:hypothetical protein